MKPTLWVVTGPTASGKTALSVALAKLLGGEVVSADSMQVYRGLDIGTAKPTAREMAGVPHHMLDMAGPGEVYSVSRYEQEAAACVEDILSRGKPVIVCGGTGLYIDALVKGSGFQPGGSPDIRAQLEARWEQDGGQSLMADLRQVDLETAERLHINDKKRIIRALEIYQLTGDTITAHNRRTQSVAPRYEARTVALYTDPREVLYRRIRDRVDAMERAGLVCEAENLYRSGKLIGTAAQAIGYKELIGYFQGYTTLPAALELIKQKSCNYAKRQLTWLRRSDNIRWIVYNSDQDRERVICEATNFLQGQG